MSARLALLAACVAAAAGGEAARGPGLDMDYGAALAYGVMLPDAPGVRAQVVTKGLTIRLAGDAAACFDPDALRWAAAWSGGWLDLAKTNIGAHKGEAPGATPVGSLRLATRRAPGWCRDGLFADPREVFHGAVGPLPRELGRWDASYRHGERVLLAYRAHGVAVRELPETVAADGGPWFVRHLEVAASGEALWLLVADAAGAGGALRSADGGIDAAEGEGEAAALDDGDQRLLAIARGADGARWRVADGRIALRLPPAGAPRRCSVAVWRGPRASAARAAATLRAVPQPGDLDAFSRGGAPRWPEAIASAGRRGDDGGAYAVDTIALPDAAAARAWLRPSALAFLPDGRMAMATLNGDVWIASGIDDGLTRVSWRRFAAGLYEPMGLVAIDGALIACGRDQLTRLVDLDSDGEADAYENLNNDRLVYPTYHTFAFDLQRDRAGDLYYAVGGNQCPPGTPWHDGIVRVSADGARAEMIARGLRAPNGLAIAPDGALVCGDNQGHWVPSSKVVRIAAGRHHGYVGDPRHGTTVAPPAAEVVPPWCWLPMGMDNSSGGQVFAPAGWGALGGTLLHASYGECALIAILPDASPGAPQAAAVRLPISFASGVMRGRFGPDGHLYLAGLKGWQTRAGADGCVQRVRLGAAAPTHPIAFATTARGVRLRFAVALDRELAEDPANYACQQWDYRWHEAYGSPDVSLADPSREGRDAVPVLGATLSSDGREIEVALDGLRRCMQWQLTLKLATADGDEAACVVAGTINRERP